MPVLENIEPKSVFSFFEQLSAIPHGRERSAGGRHSAAEVSQTHCLFIWTVSPNPDPSRRLTRISGKGRWYA